uniref:F-box domain-containing protein n=1 Tax=Ditylenchus dipsaci TaxID=166011 RepID=A0A915EI76_9BILA
MYIYVYWCSIGSHSVRSEQAINTCENCNRNVCQNHMVQRILCCECKQKETPSRKKVAQIAELHKPITRSQAPAKQGGKCADCPPGNPPINIRIEVLLEICKYFTRSDLACLQLVSQHYNNLVQSFFCSTGPFHLFKDSLLFDPNISEEQPWMFCTGEPEYLKFIRIKTTSLNLTTKPPIELVVAVLSPLKHIWLGKGLVIYWPDIFAKVSMEEDEDTLRLPGIFTNFLTGCANFRFMAAHLPNSILSPTSDLFKCPSIELYTHAEKFNLPIDDIVDWLFAAQVEDGGKNLLIYVLHMLRPEYEKMLVDRIKKRYLKQVDKRMGAFTFSLQDSSPMTEVKKDSLKKPGADYLIEFCYENHIGAQEKVLYIKAVKNV